MMEFVLGTSQISILIQCNNRYCIALTLLLLQVLTNDYVLRMGFLWETK